MAPKIESKLPKAVAYRTTVDGEPFIFVTGYIFEGFGLMLADYVHELAGQHSGKPVVLYLDSGGGLLKEAFSFYDFVRAKGLKIRVEGYGIVGSAATVVAMAAGKENIILSENADFFVHRARYVDEYGRVVDGDDAELDRVNAKLVSVYMAHTGLSESEVIALLDAGDENQAFSASRAVELGFAASVIQTNTERLAAFRAAATNNNPEAMSTKKVAVKLTLLQAVAALTAEGTTVEVDVDAKTADEIANLKAEAEAKAKEAAEAQAKLAEAEKKAADAEAAKTQAETAKAEAEKKATEADTAKAEIENSAKAEKTKLEARILELENTLDLPAAKRTVAKSDKPTIGNLPEGGQKASDRAAEDFRSSFTGMEIEAAKKTAKA